VDSLGLSRTLTACAVEHLGLMVQAVEDVAAHLPGSPALGESAIGRGGAACADCHGNSDGPRGLRCGWRLGVQYDHGGIADSNRRSP